MILKIIKSCGAVSATPETYYNSTFFGHTHMSGELWIKPVHLYILMYVIRTFSQDWVVSISDFWQLLGNCNI